MRKILSLVLASVLLIYLGVVAFGYDSTGNDTFTYEFGSLIGTQLSMGKVGGKKVIGFSTDIDKLSVYGNNTKLYATVEVVLRATGVTVGEEQAPITTNKLSIEYNWQCSSSAGNNNEVTSYGAHEVRGYNSYVVYTELVGV